MKKKNWKGRILRIFVATVIIIFIGGYIGLHHVAPYIIIKPPRANCTNYLPESYQLESKKIAITTRDSIQLKGYWTKSELDSVRGVFVLVHGIGGCKESFLPLAKNLAKMGIESVLVDNRAHGQSDGEFTTYGYKEKQDIKEIVDFIKDQNAEVPIGIWGNSLGGAIAIQSLEYDERIQFGIIESTFTDLGQIVFDYKKRLLRGFGFRFASDIALNKAGQIADFPPSEVSPITSVKNIEQPIFFAHGDADTSIKYEYGQQLYEHTKSTNKEFYLVKGAGHYGLAEIGGRDYWNHITAFINKNLH
jgi:hypothetical protein